MAFDSTVNREVGLRLRRLREQKELTRERLAEYADISVQFLADIETGRKGMTVQTLRKLVNALHCSADDIVFGPAQPADAGAALPPAFQTLTPAQASLAADILALVLKALPVLSVSSWRKCKEGLRKPHGPAVFAGRFYAPFLRPGKPPFTLFLCPAAWRRRGPTVCGCRG